MKNCVKSTAQNHLPLENSSLSTLILIILGINQILLLSLQLDFTRLPICIL